MMKLRTQASMFFASCRLPVALSVCAVLCFVYSLLPAGGRARVRDVVVVTSLVSSCLPTVLCLSTTFSHPDLPQIYNSDGLSIPSFAAAGLRCATYTAPMYLSPTHPHNVRRMPPRDSFCSSSRICRLCTRGGRYTVRRTHTIQRA